MLCLQATFTFADTISIDQIELLKNRLVQAKSELAQLQRQQDKRIEMWMPAHVNKALLDHIELKIVVAKSNLDSINIELTDSLQSITRLEKDNQDIENQLNIFNIFGLKIARNGAPNQSTLQSELSYQQKMLATEKLRSSYLTKLQAVAENTVQLYKAQYEHVRLMLKTETLMQLKEQQAKSEINLQQQQNDWLQRLSNLYQQLNHAQNKATYAKLENDIFYANEHANLTYLQLLMARYQDQLQELQVSVSRSSSIILLDKVSEQAQALDKQLQRLTQLFLERTQILDKRKAVLQENKLDLTELNILNAQYKAAIQVVTDLNQQLIVLHGTINDELKQALAARQGLPGFGTKVWLGLENEILLVPTLTFQIIKSLAHAFIKTVVMLHHGWWLLFGLLEAIWIASFYAGKQLLNRLIKGMKDHELGHINLKWLLIEVLRRCWINIALFGNIYWLFSFSGIPSQNFDIIIHLGLVWLFFKAIILITRLCLVETLHDRTGHDVRVYNRLRSIFIVGAIITALTVFLHQLPLIYEVKDFSDRLFLFFLLIVSIFLLKYWRVLPDLILPHIDHQRTYFKKVVLILGLLIPIILLVNALIGFFGFVNFILTISWYEGIFLLVLVGYLAVRGILRELMEFVSRLLIQHVSNGWLWTEAFLKPLDNVLRIVLFLAAWVVLFFSYGWNQKSPVVERLNTLLHIHLFDMLNTSFTPLSIIELAIIVSVLYWAARWTREFVYRFLLSRTKDSGIRNSIAILSQYSMIVLGLFICLRVLGIDFKTLVAVAGLFSLGVGLGLRDIANNFVCGFILLIERPLRVGDIISINGYEGEVTHIGGRAVTVRSWDHMDVLVPNAEIFSKSFVNWTAKDNIVRAIITIKINRHDSPHDVQALIYQVLDAHKNVLQEPAPEVFLKELADGLIEFEVRYFINLRQVKSRIGLRSEILLSIWEAFEKHGIKPPYPHREIYLKEGPLAPSSQ